MREIRTSGLTRGEEVVPLCGIAYSPTLPPPAEQFLAVLKDPNDDKHPKARALKFVIHFGGNLHQPLHDEDNGDSGGNTRRVIFDGHPDNLHWVWDTGLLQDINRNPVAFAADSESRITPRDEADWQKGSIEDWVMEGHRLA